jgi:dihydrofolate reductase
MRKLIVQQLVSADGYASTQDGGIDFFDVVSDFSEVDRDNISGLRGVDTVLLGRSTYEMFVQYWPTADAELVAEAVNTAKKVVFSRTMTDAPWGRWQPCQVAKDAVPYVTSLKSSPGKDLLLWGSLSIAKSLAEAGLVDEYQLRILPVTIGRGISTFPDTPARRRMELVEAKPYRSGIVSVTYTTGQ